MFADSNTLFEDIFDIQSKCTMWAIVGLETLVS
jgi:hypothetical protein